MQPNVGAVVGATGGGGGGNGSSGAVAGPVPGAAEPRASDRAEVIKPLVEMRRTSALACASTAVSSSLTVSNIPTVLPTPTPPLQAILKPIPLPDNLPRHSHALLESIRRNSILSSLTDVRKTAENAIRAAFPSAGGASVAAPQAVGGLATQDSQRISIMGSSRIISQRHMSDVKPVVEAAELTDRKKHFLVELHDQMHPNSKEEESLAKQKEVAVIRRILEKPTESRDTSDVDCLFDWVMRNGCTSKIFQGAQEIVCKTICREMTLLELPANGVVCYQGDYGDVFFIIISGSVSLFLDGKHKGRSADTYDRRKSSTPLAVDNNGRLVPTEGYGQFIKQIFSGGTFGELAVMDPTAKRSCTIICDVPTSFICLKRGAYQRLIRLTNSFQLDFTQVEFLETLSLFSAWPHGQLTRLSNRLRHMDFQADTYMTRIGSETNSMYFIYSGIVQESIPLYHYLDENGVVVKCTTVQNETFKHNLQELTGKEQQRRRVCLELNVYQDHDVCGEFAVLFNKSFSNTDLLAITEVRTLIMDRETWKEMRSMMGLDHIKDCYHKFRNLADARENWRQTRIKLALTNPGMVMSLTTRMMMKDGKCICGWCGSSDHITGDRSCPEMVESKKKQADKEKTAARGVVVAANNYLVGPTDTPTSTPPATAKAHDSSSASLTSAASSRRTSAISMPGTRSRPVSVNLMQAADTSTPAETDPFDVPLMSPAAENAGKTMGNELQLTSLAIMELKKQRKSMVVTPILEASSHSSSSSFAAPRKCSAADEPVLSTLAASMPDEALSSERLSSQLRDPHEELRRQSFTDHIESQYREQLVRRVRRIHSIEEYRETRDKVLQKIDQMEIAQPTTAATTSTAAASGATTITKPLLPKKPRIPKPRRFIVGPHEAPPTRFNRRINRMLRKVRAKQKPLPIVEESLRDDMPASTAKVKPSNNTPGTPSSAVAPTPIRNLCDLKHLR